MLLTMRDKIHENIIYGAGLSEDLNKVINLAIKTVWKG